LKWFIEKQINRHYVLLLSLAIYYLKLQIGVIFVKYLFISQKGVVSYIAIQNVRSVCKISHCTIYMLLSREFSLAVNTVLQINMFKNTKVFLWLARSIS